MAGNGAQCFVKLFKQINLFNLHNFSPTGSMGEQRRGEVTCSESLSQQEVVLGFQPRKQGNRNWGGYLLLHGESCESLEGNDLGKGPP